MTRATARVLALLMLTLTAACGGARGPSDDSTHAASRFSPQGTEAARHFLHAYVTDDGRVLRHDQGDDVVSEGQAYGMLIAELVGDDDVVRRIWSWTREHLRRPDGLLSFHADSRGKVLDPESATDADTLAAYALLRYDGAGAAGLHHDGRVLADAVLAHETAHVGSGDGLVPVAGSWVHGEPAVVNPSYWMPDVSRALAGLTGDKRWSAIASTSVRLVDELTQGGKQLPPDWAELSGGQLRPTGPPGASGAPQYGPDAQRVPLFFAATTCDDRAVRLAAAWWRLLGADGPSAALALDPGGSVTDGTRAPLALLASAATARAAGDRARAAELVGSATEQTRSTPTYYGDAWLALAAGLAEQRLGTC